MTTVIKQQISVPTNMQRQTEFQFLLLWAMNAIEVLWKWNANVCIRWWNIKLFPSIIIKIMEKNLKLFPFQMLNNRTLLFSFLSFFLSHFSTTRTLYLHYSMCLMYSYLNIYFSVCVLQFFFSILFVELFNNALHFHSMFCGTEKLTWILTILK